MELISQVVRGGKFQDLPIIGRRFLSFCPRILSIVLAVPLCRIQPEFLLTSAVNRQTPQFSLLTLYVLYVWATLSFVLCSHVQRVTAGGGLPGTSSWRCRIFGQANSQARAHQPVAARSSAAARLCSRSKPTRSAVCMFCSLSAASLSAHTGTRQLPFYPCLFTCRDLNLALMCRPVCCSIATESSSTCSVFSAQPSQHRLAAVLPGPAQCTSKQHTPASFHPTLSA